MTQLYIDRMGHAWSDTSGSGSGTGSGDGHGDDVPSAGRRSAYAANLAQVDAALLSRTSNTYGMLTSDDPFQYLGGIALAVRQLTGRDPALYVQNLRDGSEVRTDTADTAIAKEMQSRYLHPQWIAAQQAEGYSGTLQVLKTAQFLWGWQATAPQAVRQDHWQSLHDVYVRDRYQLGTREWLERDNRGAFTQTLERMLDAVRLGYWQPDAATRGELVQAYTEALKATGLAERNSAVERFAASEIRASQGEPSTASAPALRRPAPAPVEVQRSAAPPPAEAAEARPELAAAPTGSFPVQGLKLEPVPDRPRTPPAPVLQSLWAAFGAALVLALGAWVQWRRGRPASDTASTVAAA